jgi:SAM-dependent methyltransferase
VITEKLKRFFYALEDRWFDFRHNIDSAGVIPPGDLSAGTNLSASERATAYQSVWTRNLRALLRACAKAGMPRTFIDIGSGKGKACIYASRHFERVIGVEYAGALVAAARENQLRSGTRNIEFAHADAADFDLPAERSLVFLFNPFDDVILDAFMARNDARIRAHGSLIAYANDLHRATLENLGYECLFRDPARSISLWR